MFTDLSVVEKFLSSIHKNVNPQKVTFYIHGGETFLAPLEYLSDVNKVIKKYFGDIKIDIIPQTNLIYKVDQEFVDFIKKEYRGTIGVSWDADIRFGSVAINKKTEQEEIFFKNLRFLIDNGIKVHIAITAQKNLLNYDPLEIVEKFDGVDSIDFELLTTFDDQTRSLRPNNLKWADWLDRLVTYYEKNETTWCLPQIDLFTKTLLTGKMFDCKCNCCDKRTFTLNPNGTVGGKMFDCKCNCCDKRTFTLNPNGTVGLCPDMTYVEPFSTVEEMSTDWTTFESKSLDLIMKKLVEQQEHEMCFKCEHYDICGGNCDASLFDNTEECPLSKKVITRIRSNINNFIRLYEQKAKVNLTELRENYE